MSEDFATWAARASRDSEAELEERGGAPNPKRVERLAVRYANARESLEQIESELARVLKRWNKARADVRRYSRALDKIDEKAGKT